MCPTSCSRSAETNDCQSRRPMARPNLLGLTSLAGLNARNTAKRQLIHADWLRTFYGVVGNIKVANYRQYKRVMHSNAISNGPLGHGDDRSPHNGHDQKARTIARTRPKFGDAQSEDTRKHDRIEKSHKYDA